MKWVTWENIGVDRMACAWLIKKYVDKNAKFLFVTDRPVDKQPNGPPEPLQTTTIECRKANMQCLESAATVVFVGDRGVLESVQTVFDVDHWTEGEIVSKPTPVKCVSRTLVLDLANKRTRSRVSSAEESGTCKARPEGTLDLVTGFRVREGVQQKASQ